MLREPAFPRLPLRAAFWLLPAAILALLAACASIPPPTGTMDRARASLKAAEQAGAADADPVDLEFARGKLQQARQALAKGKNGPAGDLAQESIADSRLAQTKARLASVRAQVQAQQKENRRLRKQLLERAASKHPAAAATQPSSVQELPQTTLSMPTSPASAPPSPQPAPAGSSMKEGQ